MREKTFTDTKGSELIVKNRKSAVFLEIKERDNASIEGFYFNYIFSEKQLIELYNYLYEAGDKSWNNFNPDNWNSRGSDYYEYYDRDLDNNGYLSLGLHGIIKAERPSLRSNRLYKFNKLKFQAFVHDLNKCIERIGGIQNV